MVIFSVSRVWRDIVYVPPLETEKRKGSHTDEI
jgi:hypothetical protein